MSNAPLNEVTGILTSQLPHRETRGERSPLFARVIVHRFNRSFSCGSHPRHTIYGWEGGVCSKCYVDVWHYFKPLRPAR